MHIEIINTGTELLLGNTLNTHGAWLGQELFPLGLRVARQTTIGDGDPIREVLVESLKRSDVILITGGLGPTSDDVTREAVAEALGIELIEDEAAVRSLRAFFEKLNRYMPETNLRQAQVPVGATVIPNARGTAPGLYLPPRLSGEYRCATFLLPGPPRELHPMFREEILPILRALAGVEDQRGMSEWKYSGIGESDLAERVDAELLCIDGLEIGYCARPGEVDVRLIGRQAAVEAGQAILRQKLCDHFVSEDGSSLEAALVKEATERGLKVSFAESCTGGLLASRLTDVPGSSAVFQRSWVSYANEAKIEELGVPEELIQCHGAVSREVAEAMALGAKQSSGADLAVAVTGIAGPGGGSEEKPVGTVWFAWALADGSVVSRQKRQARGRLMFKQVVSQEALFGLLRAARGQQI